MIDSRSRLARYPAGDPLWHVRCALRRSHRLRMGFLDNIGQRPSESRPTAPPPAVTPNLIRDDAARPVRTTPAPDSLQTNRIHPVVIWGAALIVVAAIAGGAWLGVQRSAFFSPVTETETAANASPETPAAPAAQPDEKRKVPRSQTAVRAVTRGDAALAAPGGATENASEADAPAIAPVSEAASLIETAATSEGVSDPFVPASIAAFPEDDYVYSSEGAGVVAPRLTSLGFVHRLVSGLRVRTSTIEMVVSKSGTVEQARIFSSPAHWEDALLLSRAKMFKFVPASRNGSPVRYRFVMDVDTSP